jgi:hypothetical protein
MPKENTAGSAAITTGFVLAVCAVIVCTFGAGGYESLGSNPDATSLVAGCALFSTTLLCVTLFFVISGFRSRTQGTEEHIRRLCRRIDRLERLVGRTASDSGRSGSDQQPEGEADDWQRDIMGTMREMSAGKRPRFAGSRKGSSTTREATDRRVLPRGEVDHLD